MLLYSFLEFLLKDLIHHIASLCCCLVIQVPDVLVNNKNYHVCY